MENAILIKHASPHVKRKDNLLQMLLDVAIALLPCVIFAFIVYPLGATKNILLSIATMELCELIFVFVTNPLPIDLKKHSIKERFSFAIKKYKWSNFLAALVSAMIYALILPSSAPIYAVILGAAFGITLGKLVYGGTGYNLFNPAAIGMVFAKICFGSSFKYESTSFYTVDAVTGATSLGTGGLISHNPFNSFLGLIPGTIGEGCKLAILIGLVYLLVRRAADYRVVLSYSATFIVLVLVMGLSLTINGQIAGSEYMKYISWQLLSGGFFFGATFMITDPVTMPLTSPSRYIYGMIAAIVAVFIRAFAALPEGVAYGILIANCLASVLDYPKWSSPLWGKKDIILASSLGLVSILIVLLVGSTGGISL